MMEGPGDESVPVLVINIFLYSSEFAQVPVPGYGTSIKMIAYYVQGRHSPDASTVLALANADTVQSRRLQAELFKCD
jgi:hypothetical protein